MTNPLLLPYIGECCPHCGREYRTIEDMRGTKFGASAEPVHGECWNAYTGAMVKAIQELCEDLFSRMEEKNSGLYRYHVELTRENLDIIHQFIRPARNH